MTTAIHFCPENMDVICNGTDPATMIHEHVIVQYGIEHRRQWDDNVSPPKLLPDQDAQLKAA